MIAYTVNALYWMYLRTQGIDTHSHPVRSELERVKECLRKVKQAEVAAASLHARRGNEKHELHGREDGGSDHKQVKLNVAAAKRFVAAALGEHSDPKDHLSDLQDNKTTSMGRSAISTPDDDAGHSRIAADLAGDYFGAACTGDSASASACSAEHARIIKQLKKEVKSLQKRGVVAVEGTAQGDLQDLGEARKMTSELMEHICSDGMDREWEADEQDVSAPAHADSNAHSNVDGIQVSHRISRLKDPARPKGGKKRKAKAAAAATAGAEMANSSDMTTRFETTATSTSTRAGSCGAVAHADKYDPTEDSGHKKKRRKPAVY